MTSPTQRLSVAVCGLLLVAITVFQEPAPLDYVVQAQFGLVMVVVAIAALILMRASRQQARIESWIWGGVLVGIGVISGAMSPFPAFSLVRLLLYVALVLTAAAVMRSCRGRPASLQMWLLAICGCGLPFLGHALIVMLTLGDGPLPAVLGAFANVRHLGSSAFLVAAAGSAWVLIGRHRVLAGMTTTFALFVVMVSGSRGALLFWTVFLALIVILVPRMRRVLLGHAACTFGGAALLTIVVDVMGWTTLPTVFARVAAKTGEINEVSSGRVEVWKQSIDQVLREPWLGAGPDAYRLTECCGSSVAHPHNVVLQLLMEFGLVGCAVLLLWLGRATLRHGIRRLWRAALGTTENTVLTVLLCVLLAYGMIDGTYYWLLPMFHTAVFVGLWLAGVSSALRDDQSRPMENVDSRS